MGCEAEVEQQHSSIPKLPLMSSLPPPMQSPERPSGMVTPPLHASAAVPFRWEQEPGKPIPCTALLSFPKSLELPPRLLLPDVCGASNRFLHSPSPSFRIMSNDCYGGSFGASERGVVGAMVLTKGKGNKDKGWWWFGSWRRKKKGFKVRRDVTGGSHVFPSSVERESGSIEVGGTHNEVNLSKMKRSGSFSSLSHGKSPIWTTIYEGLKQVVPWRSRKLRKDGSGPRL